MNEVRVGRVSSINYEAGTARIVYSDKSEKGTAELPVFCGFGEYQMPKVDDQVLVLHLSNDSSMGIVMGRFWSERLLPPGSGPELFYKKLSEEGTAFLRQLGGAVTLCGGEIFLQGSAGTITLTQLLEMKRKLDAL